MIELSGKGGNVTLVTAVLGSAWLRDARSRVIKTIPNECMINMVAGFPSNVCTDMTVLRTGSHNPHRAPGTGDARHPLPQRGWGKGYARHCRVQPKAAICELQTFPRKGKDSAATLPDPRWRSKLPTRSPPQSAAISLPRCSASSRGRSTRASNDRGKGCTMS